MEANVSKLFPGLFVLSRNESKISKATETRSVLFLHKSLHVHLCSFPITISNHISAKTEFKEFAGLEQFSTLFIKAKRGNFFMFQVKVILHNENSYPYY